MFWMKWGVAFGHPLLYQLCLKDEYATIEKESSDSDSPAR